ncbi:hypothetical protein TNCV_1726451 [Trichonephila clavipes]|nr:hypothetical protein TNCV_1726451 [Trichonephila clavipes]
METVSRFWIQREKAWTRCPRATMAREDRHLSIIAMHNRWAADSQLSCSLYAATETRVSRVAVSKRLHERGLFS